MTPTIVHIDTHVALWLHDAVIEKLLPARAHLEGHELRLSPMAVLELQYLYEIGRLSLRPAQVLASLQGRFGLQLAHGAWTRVVEAALPMSWTRDPFDRLIAAHALVDEVALVTADEKIRLHCPHAVWG